LPHFPGKEAISESGISDPEIVKELRALGYLVLIGENFMKTNDPERVVLRSFKIYRSQDHQSLWYEKRRILRLYRSSILTLWELTIP
jgi:hypothetical protein